MKAAAIPAKFNIPFASAAGASYIRPIPQASQIGITDGAASLTDGFPPLNFLPVGSGGIPPFGQDFNGLLKQVTQWNQWAAAEGPVFYDATFAAAVGGYPKGAVVLSPVDYVTFWLCTVDDNSSNPDTGGANWVKLDYQIPFGTAAGTANAITTTLSPAPYPVDWLHIRLFLVRITALQTGACTIAPNGLAARTIVMADGVTTPPGKTLSPGAVAFFYNDGTNVRLLGAFGGATGVLGARGAYSQSVAGSYNFTVPDGVYALYIELVGGGGGGGGCGAAIGGTGGGGAGFTAGVNLVTPGQVLAIVVGAKGTGGAPTVDGTDGTASTIVSLGLTAQPGGKGSAGGVAGGASGGGTGGQKNLTGGGGGSGFNIGGYLLGGTGGGILSTAGLPNGGVASSAGGGGAGGGQGPTPGGNGHDGYVLITY